LEFFHKPPTADEVLKCFEESNLVYKNQFDNKPGSFDNKPGSLILILKMNDKNGTANYFYDTDGFQGIEVHYRVITDF